MIKKIKYVPINLTLFNFVGVLIIFVVQFVSVTSSHKYSHMSLLIIILTEVSQLAQTSTAVIYFKLMYCQTFIPV